MTDEFSAKELRSLIKEGPKIYREVMRSHIDNYFEAHPSLIVDDADSGKVIAVSVKGSPVRESSSEPGLITNKSVCIKPFSTNQQYYVLIGDDSDFNSSLANKIHPMAMVQEFITRYQLNSNGIPPPGRALADVVRQCLDDKISDAYPSGNRPRNVEVILISNPSPDNQLPREDYTPKIYLLQHAQERDNVIIQAMQTTRNNPAHFCHREAIWQDYLDYARELKTGTGKSRRVKRFTQEDKDLKLKITAAIAAVMTYSRVKTEGPSIVDVVTVPFEPPVGNKNRARYDVEFVAPLYERALQLIHR